jgi:hypothetical protein
MAKTPVLRQPNPHLVERLVEAFKAVIRVHVASGVKDTASAREVLDALAQTAGIHIAEVAGDGSVFKIFEATVIAQIAFSTKAQVAGHG